MKERLTPTSRKIHALKSSNNTGHYTTKQYCLSLFAFHYFEGIFTLCNRDKAELEKGEEVGKRKRQRKCWWLNCSQVYVRIYKWVTRNWTVGPLRLGSNIIKERYEDLNGTQTAALYQELMDIKHKVEQSRWSINRKHICPGTFVACRSQSSSPLISFFFCAFELFPKKRLHWI